MTTYANHTEALDAAIGLLEGLAKDVAACEYLDDSMAQKPTVLDSLRAARAVPPMPDSQSSKTADIVTVNEAAREVLRHRQGELPSQGWLRDNAQSRNALAQLAVAVAARATGEMRESCRPGDTEPHDDVERTINVVRNAYGWAVDHEGRVCGLVAGDMGYESTHIVITPDNFPDTSELVAVLRRAMPYLIHARDRALYRDAGLEAGAIGTVLFDANEAIRKATGKEALNPTFTALIAPTEDEG